jgi:hypothetical protein
LIWIAPSEQRPKDELASGEKEFFSTWKWPPGGSVDGKAGGQSYPAHGPGGTFFVKDLREVSRLRDGWGIIGVGSLET